MSTKNIAQGTMAFEFTKPKGFEFEAGQNIDITLGRNIYPFSIASSPHEKVIRIAMRMSNSEFKKSLKKLKVGDTINVQGPNGSFVLPKKSSNTIIMIAGGIGITPFMSMLSWMQYKKLKYDITLIYINSSRAKTAFLKELEDFKNIKSRIVFRRLNNNDIEINSNAIYYVAGPPAFVIDTSNMLGKAGITMDSIKTEEFSGY